MATPLLVTVTELVCLFVSTLVEEADLSGVVGDRTGDRAAGVVGDLTGEPDDTTLER